MQDLSSFLAPTGVAELRRKPQQPLLLVHSTDYFPSNDGKEYC